MSSASATIPSWKAPRGLEALDPGEFDQHKAHHLARRAGFGVAADTARELVQVGLEEALSRFLDYPAEDEALAARLQALGSELDPHGDASISSYDMVERLRECWIFRLVHTAHPLRERLVFFWHNHFAVQASKVVRSPLLWQQNELFRRLGASSFRELLHAVAASPAMLVYLDNRLSCAGQPNENWARELLELFTLGIDRYSQADVIALARTFTGWTTPEMHSTEFRFDPQMHDPGPKHFLGLTLEGRPGASGQQEGQLALEHILAQPACAEFLARKLLLGFAGEAGDPRMVHALAETLLATDWSIRESLRVLFRSRWFYASERVFTLYKSPLEWLVSAARLLGLQNVHRGSFLRHTRAMGMQLFEPPSVAGWQGGAAWHNSGATLKRLELALAIAELAHSSRPVLGRAALDYDALVPPTGTRAAWIDAICERLLQRPLSAHLQALLLEQLETRFGALPQNPSAKAVRAEVRHIVHACLTSPLFALA